MNKKLKSQLKAVFDVPAPERKTEFLQLVNFPAARRFDFILGQIGYIRKRVWVISCILVTAAIFGLRAFTDTDSLNLIWIISSILPFVSLITVTEISRSASYNMAELEMSCKNNFAAVMLTRLGILCFFDILLFGVIILSFLGKVSFSIFQVGLYLLVPFMLTCSTSLFAVNRLRSRETTYICGCISCFIGIANALFTNLNKTAFSDEYLVLWVFAFIILAVWTIIETMKLIKKTEEFQWNLS